jgi:SET domain-containing protein
MTDQSYDDNPRARVAESPIHGRGLFARQPIARDDYIGTYEGPSTQTDGMHVLWLWNEDTDRWEGIDGRNEMRFLNHSKTPNADWWDTDLYAIRDIAEGEEITFDYGWDDEDEGEDAS